MPLVFRTSQGNLSILSSTSESAPENLNFTLASSSSSPLPCRWASRPHRRSRRRAPYASITGASNSLWDTAVHGESIRSTFNRIDKDRKGHITEADLQDFAAAHHLPRSYVRPFLSAVLQQQQQQQQQQQLSSSEDELEGEVGYAAFREFVVSREAGLREAFSQFDLDGDGHISADDLHASLARVSICSPRSRCVLRTRQDVVGQLLARIDVDGSRRLSFGEFRRFFMLLPQQGALVEYWLSGAAALQCADMGGHFSVLERNRHIGAPWGHLLAGAVAGAASRSATAPLETLRLAAMAGALPPGSNLLSAAQGMMAEGGVAALFRGNLVNVLRSAPARAVDFFAFDLFKAWFGSDSYAKTFAAAGLAGTLSWALLYPLEVVRSRVTLGPAQRYSGLRHCVAAMAAQEGLGSFYRGLGPSLAAIAPEAAITYGLHDLLKRAYSKAHHREPDIGMLEVLRAILAEGGPAALYRGLGAATLRLVPSAIISFGTYEVMRKLLLELEAKQEACATANVWPAAACQHHQRVAPPGTT
ncbi:hypothetical protein OEZ85_014074 [Tetradesmus obliquus]|uniref:EF-hand domain-containing protein n=1 Tax=Tetradesmus obliquus TaxID=3088 RepID=A0ABY8UAT7_TETOB|nr:hypothetical protein OEZ85_014074 [Tetradesmus obliquus]